MIIEISVAVIALGCVALIIYLIKMIKALCITMGQVNQTLVEVRKQLGEVGGQAHKVLEHTNQISVDLKHKVEAFNPIFNAIVHAGEILEYKTFNLKKEFLNSSQEESDSSSSTSEEKKKIDVITVAAILELAGIGMRLWQKHKKRR